MSIFLPCVNRGLKRVAEGWMRWDVVLKDDHKEEMERGSVTGDGFNALE